MANDFSNGLHCLLGALKEEAKLVDRGKKDEGAPQAVNSRHRACCRSAVAPWCSFAALIVFQRRPVAVLSGCLNFCVLWSSQDVGFARTRLAWLVDGGAAISAVSLSMFVI